MSCMKGAKQIVCFYNLLLLLEILEDLTCYPLSVFKFPALTSKVHHWGSNLEAQLHFSWCTIQLRQECKVNISNRALSYRYIHFSGDQRGFNRESVLVISSGFSTMILSKLTVWRLDRDTDLRGGVLFGLNVFPKNGIFSDLLRSCVQDSATMIALASYEEQLSVASVCLSLLTVDHTELMLGG